MTDRRRCAFLTMANPEGYIIDDELAEGPLGALGWQVDMMPWDDEAVDWGRYDAVVVRSPWDYHHRPDDFLAVLDAIVEAGVPLENDLELVRWNLRKTYLRELEGRGVPITPTLWRPRLAAGQLEDLFAELTETEIVVKPVIAASAEGAFRLDRESLHRSQGEVEDYFSSRALMAQPLARSVLDEGEYSLFYFDGEFSHAVLKTPGQADFRTQEEHGGTAKHSQPEDQLLTTGAETVAALPSVPLYARVDLVRANGGGGFWLMELELIEPALYLRMDPEAPGRFARALDARMR